MSDKICTYLYFQQSVLNFFSNYSFFRFYHVIDFDSLIFLHTGDKYTVGQLSGFNPNYPDLCHKNPDMKDR